jgi:type III secretion protein R
VNDLVAGAPLSAALGLAVLALLPLLLMSITSFAKIAVVLSILKNALGASDIPSTAIVTALALGLSVFVMAPVASEVQSKLLASGGSSKLSAESMLAATAEPVRSFLSKNAGARETQLFVDLAKQKKMNLGKTDLPVLWPSFAITELKRAFQVGFLVFLPFLVLDLIVASVLLAMGLHGLTPAAVALPFKILLFVSVDGFMLLSRALILGYA